MQTITYDKAIEAARSFYRAGKLTAQHPNPELRQCVYIEGDCRCAIGAVLNEESIKAIIERDLNEDHDVDDLRDENIISLKDSEESLLMELQHAHDLWAIDARKDEDDDPLLIFHRAVFENLIGER